MISYNAEMLNNAINKAVIVELNTGDLLVGYFIKERKFSFDEYEKGSTAKALKEVLSFADAIMFD